MNEKRENNYLASMFSIIFSVGIIYVLCKYLPDMFPSLLVEPAPEGVINDMKGYFRPEKLERARFLISIVLFPFLLLIFNYLLIKNAFNKKHFPYLRKTYNVLALVFLGIALYAAWFVFEKVDFFFINKSYFYLHPKNYVSIFILLIALIVAIEFFLKDKVKKLTETGLSLVFKIISFGLIISTFLYCLFNQYSLHNWISYEHIDSTIYPIAQVYSGHALLVDFVNFYGLYAHILNFFIFSIIGLDVFKISVVYGLLLASTYLCYYLFLRKATTNIFIGYMGFALVLYMGFFYLPSIAENTFYLSEPYFQVWPIRVFFPAILILLSWLYLRNPQKKFLYYLGFFLFSLAVLWNLDTGAVTFAAWIMALSYSELLKFEKWATIKKIGIHIATGVIFLIAVVTIYGLYIKLAYGSFPDFSLLYKHQNLYYILGRDMLPMSLWHPWTIVAFIYIAGLAYSMKCLVLQQNTISAKSVFLLSVLGIGIFTYYQGRSLDYNLSAIIYPAMMLLVIFSDRVYTKVVSDIRARKINLAEIAVLITCLFFIFSSYPTFVENRIMFKHIKDRLKVTFEKTENPTTRMMSFIRKYAKPGDGIIILSYKAGPYYAETNTKSSANLPSITEFVMQSDYDTLLNYIKTNSNPDDKIFIQPGLYEGIHFDKSEIISAIRERYEEKESSPDNNLVLYMKKKS